MTALIAVAVGAVAAVLLLAIKNWHQCYCGLPFASWAAVARHAKKAHWS